MSWNKEFKLQFEYSKVCCVGHISTVSHRTGSINGLEAGFGMRLRGEQQNLQTSGACRQFLHRFVSPEPQYRSIHRGYNFRWESSFIYEPIEADRQQVGKYFSCTLFCWTISDIAEVSSFHPPEPWIAFSDAYLQTFRRSLGSFGYEPGY